MSSCLYSSSRPPCSGARGWLGGSPPSRVDSGLEGMVAAKQEDEEEVSFAKGPATDAGFRTLDSKDWARIESISPPTRAVGKMMCAEAERLVKESHDGGLHTPRRHEGGMRLFDIPLWQKHLEAWAGSSGRSSAAIQEKNGEKSGGKKGQAKKSEETTAMSSSLLPKSKQQISRRTQILGAVNEKTYRADEATIRDAGNTTTLLPPRPDAFGWRLEPWAVALQRWLLQAEDKTSTKTTTTAAVATVAAVSLIDRVVSGQNAIAFLEDAHLSPSAQSVCDWLREAVASLVRTHTLRSFCARLVEEERYMTRPSFLGAQKLRLYPEQVQVATAILRTLRSRLVEVSSGSSGSFCSSGRALFLRFSTPPSTGKSSAAAYIGSVYLNFWQLDVEALPRTTCPRAIPSFVVYSCYSNAVRLDVAKACVGSCVPFAIVTDNVACPSYNCYHGRPGKKDPPPQGVKGRVEYSLRLMERCDRRPVVLVCDTISAINFLAFRRTGESLTSSQTLGRCVGDVLLLDEPTAYLDEAKHHHHQHRHAEEEDGTEVAARMASQVPAQHADLLRLAPPVTVLMSATLPTLDEMRGITGAFRARFEGAEFLNVESSRLASPCTIVDAKGTAYAPHQIIRAPARDLRRTVEENTHVLRFYSPRALQCLLDDISSFSPALRQQHEDDNNDANGDNDYQAAQDMIRRGEPLSISSFALVRTCALNLLRALPDTATLWRRDLRYERPQLQTMCSTSAVKYSGSSIVISETNEEFALGALPELLKGIERLERRLKAYEVARAQEQDVVQHVPSSSGRDRRGGNGGAAAAAAADGAVGARDGRTAEKHTRLERQRDADASRVQALWPLEACVNTKAHAARFGNQLLLPFVAATAPLVDDDILHSSNAALVEGLLCGAATLESSVTDPSYVIAAMDMAERSAFSFVAAGRGMVYGVNLPCDRVIVRLRYDRCTPAILKQAVGRAGRTGKHAKSEVIFDDEDAMGMACMCPLRVPSSATEGAFFDALFVAREKGASSSAPQLGVRRTEGGGGGGGGA